MKRKHFLWPDSRALQVSDFIGSAVHPQDVEELVSHLYPESYPVLFSSARAGLHAVIDHMGLSRADHVWLPAYSSHCVIEAVALSATPTPVMTSETKAALVFHQWGYVHAAGFPSSVAIIEDSADSLLLPGRSVFALENARYALWSLPKVLGTLGGGIVFCRDRKDAEELRQIRDARHAGWIQLLLRAFARRSHVASIYWNGAEASIGRAPAPLLRQIMRKLEDMPEIARSTLQLVRMLVPEQAKELESAGRLPSNLPLTVPSWWREYWGQDGVFSAGLRHFNEARRYPDGSWTKVAPLPVHRDVDPDVLNEVKKRLDQEKS